MGGGGGRCPLLYKTSAASQLLPQHPGSCQEDQRKKTQRKILFIPITDTAAAVVGGVHQVRR